MSNVTVNPGETPASFHMKGMSKIMSFVGVFVVNSAISELGYCAYKAIDRRYIPSLWLMLAIDTNNFLS
jgi:hypothetical protein